MHSTSFAPGLVVALVVALAPRASAQTAPKEQPSDKPLETPTRALEFYGATGYTQGFGDLQSGVGMKHVITPGFATEIGAGYRIDPRWAVTLVGQYAEFDAERADTARGLVLGAAVAYHVRPYDKWDPWVQVGAGYRLLWENNVAPAPDLLTHGFELAKVTIGLDTRMSRDISFSPVVGVDLTLPLWQATNGQSSTAIADPAVSAFVFAGMQARFDLTSRFVGGPKPVSETRTTQAAVCPPAPPPVARPVSPTITASDAVLAACKLNLDDAGKAPKFDFDKAALLPADTDVLAKVAECFSTGPLKNDRVLLVGRADPRGSALYNYGLGMRRANSVAEFLAQHGVDAARIESTTRGKDDATGTNPPTWAADRRVDMLRVEIEIGAR